MAIFFLRIRGPVRIEALAISMTNASILIIPWDRVQALAVKHGV